MFMYIALFIYTSLHKILIYLSLRLIRNDQQEVSEKMHLFRIANSTARVDFRET